MGICILLERLGADIVRNSTNQRSILLYKHNKGLSQTFSWIPKKYLPKLHLKNKSLATTNPKNKSCIAILQNFQPKN